MKNETKLGIFAVMGIGAIIFSIMMTGGMTLRRTYQIRITFDNVAGIPQKARVKVAGVDIGAVRRIELAGNHAIVTAAIDKRNHLFEDATARIVSMGIIGTKYIEVTPGTSTRRRLKDGDTIQGTTIPSLEASFTGVAAQLSEFLTSVNRDTPEGTIADNLAAAIINIKRFSADMALIAADNRDDIREIMEEIRLVAQRLNYITKQISEGHGILGRLINDDAMGDELKKSIVSIRTTAEGLERVFATTRTLTIDWEYTGRFDTRDSVFRSDLGLRITPRPGKFYYIGISNIGNPDNARTPEDRRAMNRLDALLGFRGRSAEIYGGMIRTEGGFGVGWAPFGDIRTERVPLKLHADLFNFSDPNRNHPQLNIRAQAGITRWLYAGVAYEDTLERATVMPFLRLVIRDDTIASLFGLAGVAAAGSR
ncbi:MAG: MlaD family protein [Elusimicrobia bacterium]|nr:MlaD family protein [Elusimicrobiota bacterium]